VALIYVTGVAGSGKSAVCKELVARGYEAYDTDKDGFTGWIDKQTGEEVYSPREEWGKRTAEWYARHDWRTSILRATELAKKAQTTNIFLCGSGHNKRDIMKVCDLNISLNVDEEKLKERIATRKNLFGKQPHELEQILEQLKTVPEQDKAAGAVIVNTSRPLGEVVDDILRIADTKKSGPNK